MTYPALEVSAVLSNEGEVLRKLFSTFPTEWPGVGLLLIRAAVALSLFIQGMAQVQSPTRGLTEWCLAALSFSAGAFLLVGFMTPLVAVIVVLGGTSSALVRMPVPGHDLFDSYVAIVNLITLSIAIALLGPGAYSLDARMFGRREIIIPSNSRSGP